MKQKRQLIDHWVASRGPFLRFLFHFRDKSFFMTTGATLVRYEQPSEGSASPPWVIRSHTRKVGEDENDILQLKLTKQVNFFVKCMSSKYQ